MKVSPSTVSRALNDNPRISKSTRQEIQLLARQKGYEPNFIASSLRQGKSSTVGVVVPRINRHFFSNIIGGMEVVLNSAGYNLVICQSSENYETELANLKSLHKLRVDAIFISLSASTKDNSHIKELIDRGNRLFLFDRTDERINAPQVMVDDFRGAYELVTHLIQEGYRKIYHFSGPSIIKVYRERKMAYLKAMQDHGIEVTPAMMVSDCITKEKGFESMTSVDQKARLMGKKLAELFLQENKPAQNHLEIINPELIIRNSTLKNK